MSVSRLVSLGLAALLAAGPLSAQSPASSTDSARSATPAPAAPRPAAAPAAPALNFSGIIFGSYNVQRPTGTIQLPNQADNSFVIDRAYLNFRIAAGDRTSIRITTDVYQSTETNANAYTIRAKYAYLQYEVPKHASGAQLLGRIGILQNVVIEHQDAFWPRWLSQAALERAGYFSSADVGIAGQLTLPNKLGEVYTTIVNGPGYTTRERDRFKDFAARLSLTPFANRTGSALMQSFTLTGWGYRGATASGFVNGGTNQLGAVGDALDRTRYGVFAGVRDPRLVLGAEAAQRHEGGESGANTAASPRTLTETTGRLLSAFTVVRPLAFVNATGKSPFGVVGRYDHITPTASTVNLPAARGANAYHTLIGGVFWDISQKAQIALDYQESLASDNGSSNAPPTPLKAYYAHFVVTF
jgi:hypothetical protein